MELTVFSLLTCLAAGILVFQGVQAARYRSERLNLPVAIAAAVLAVAGVVAFALRLGHPAMLFGAFSNLTSGITLLLYASVLFVVVAVVFAVLSFRSDDGSVPAWCGVLAIVAGVLLMLGTAFGCLTILEGFKLTAFGAGSAALVFFFVTSALTLGCLAIMALAAAMNDEDALALARRCALACVLLNAAAVAVYFVWFSTDAQAAAQVTRSSYDMQHNSFTYGGAVAALTASASDKLAVVLSGASAPVFWGGAVVCGLALPAVAGAVALVKKERNVLLALGVAAFVLALVGAACMRVALLALA